MKDFGYKSHRFYYELTPKPVGHDLVKKSENENFNLDFIPLFPIFKPFFADPPNSVGILTEALHIQSFPIPLEFFSCLNTLIDNRPHESIHLLNAIVNLPSNFWENNFLLKAKEFVPNLIKHTQAFPEIVTIFTTLLQTSPNFDSLFLNFEIPESVFLFLKLERPSLIVFSFFRHFPRYKIAYMMHYSIYYDFIREAVNRYVDPIQTQCAHVLYHYLKGLFCFDKNIKKKEIYFPDFLSHLQMFLSLPNASKDLIMYTLKMIRIITREKQFRNFIIDLNLFPHFIRYLELEIDDMTLLILNIIYNFLYDNKKKAILYLSEYQFLPNLLQNFQKYSFKTQEEIIYIFNEFTRYETTDNLVNLLETLPLDQIFLDFLPSSDPDLFGEMIIGLDNALIVFNEKERSDLIERYFFNEEFLNILTSLDDKNHKRNYYRFCRKIQNLSQNHFECEQSLHNG